ncbi:MAG: phosphonate ABC transporter ATP-binding protein [Cyanobacteria bacterium J06642_2]
MLSLQIRQLCKVFPNGTRALDRVNLLARPGEGIVLLGANGSGKSTLLRCIVGLENLTSGSVKVGDRELTTLSASELRAVRRRLGLVFQHFNLVGNLSAFHNVLHGALGRSRGPHFWLPATAPEAERQRGMACLARVGLADRAEQRTDTLSGGQLQRVAIARMLMQDPEIVLADEPVASLDPKAGREIMDLLWEIVRERQLTVICALHQLELARAYADRIVGLNRGRVQLDRRASEVDAAELDWLYRNPGDRERAEVSLQT